MNGMTVNGSGSLQPSRTIPVASSAVGVLVVDVRIMITGHRPGAKLVEDKVLPSMVEILETLKAESTVTVISGGADGVDRLWARAAHQTGVPYELWLPASYYDHYKLSNKDWTSNIQWNAERIEHVGGMGAEFSIANNFVRNTAMIDTANMYVVCGYKHPRDLVKLKSGGTVHATKELMKRKLPVIWIDSKTGETEFVECN